MNAEQDGFWVRPEDWKRMQKIAIDSQDLARKGLVNGSLLGFGLGFLCGVLFVTTLLANT